MAGMGAAVHIAVVLKVGPILDVAARWAVPVLAPAQSADVQGARARSAGGELAAAVIVDADTAAGAVACVIMARERILAGADRPAPDRFTVGDIRSLFCVHALFQAYTCAADVGER